MKKVSILTILFTLIAGFTIAAEVNVFNARHYKADGELYSKFTNMTKKRFCNFKKCILKPPEQVES